VYDIETDSGPVCERQDGICIDPPLKDKVFLECTFVAQPGL